MKHVASLFGRTTAHIKVSYIFHSSSMIFFFNKGMFSNPPSLSLLSRRRYSGQATRGSKAMLQYINSTRTESLPKTGLDCLHVEGPIRIRL